MFRPRENTITSAALEAIEQLPVIRRSWMKLQPLKSCPRPIDVLQNGKAPVLDGVPPEVTKRAKNTLLSHLYYVLC